MMQVETDHGMSTSFLLYHHKYLVRHSSRKNKRVLEHERGKRKESVSFLGNLQKFTTGRNGTLQVFFYRSRQD